jgi:hypothetical protein
MVVHRNGPDIATLVREKENDTAHKELREQMQGDFDNGFILTPTIPEKSGYQSYTSSQPRNFLDKVLDGLNRAQMQIQIKTPEDATEEDKKFASKGELFLFGAFADIDRNLADIQEPPLRQGIGFQGCVRGWIAVKCLVFLPDGEETVRFEVIPWDLMHTYWETGKNGLIWAAYVRSASKEQVDDEYPDYKPSTSASNPTSNPSSGKTNEFIIIDFWDKETNYVVINGTTVIEEKHEMDHVPVYIDAVGSMPTMQNQDFSTTLEHKGASVWAAARHLISPRNKYIGWVMDKAKNHVAGTIIFESEDGLKGIKGDPYDNYQVVKIKIGEKIYPLPVPAAPPEMAAVLGILQEDWQQSTLPYPLAFGGTKEAMSGRALSVLADATRSVYTPRTGALARAYIWLCEEILEQFSTKSSLDGKSVVLQGNDAQDNFFRVETTPDSIDQEWFVSVTVEPRMPRDREAEIQMGIAARSPGADGMPLLSQATLHEEYLQIRDPQSERGKILLEMGKAMPVIMVKEIAAALTESGREDLAQALIESTQGPATPDGSPDGAIPATGISPELLEAIVKTLAEVGAEQLAEDLLQQLGTTPEGPAEEPVPAGAV